MKSILISQRTIVTLLAAIVCVFTLNGSSEAQTEITGPWLWMIAPTEPGRGGRDSTNVDSLAATSGGAVTETDIATNGATEGDVVGNYAWTLGVLNEYGDIEQMLVDIGMTETRNIDNFSSYALITLVSETDQPGVTMHTGSDDSIKVWLNGENVFTNAVNRGRYRWQDNFQVNLKKGDNLLLVKVSELGGGWGMHVGIGTEVTLKVPTRVGTPTETVETPTAQYIYWADAGTDKIQRSNLDGSNVRDLITSLGRPTGITLDMSGGKVYWSVTNPNDIRNSIQRSNLDGTNVETLVTGGTSIGEGGEGIALDTIGGKMYWAYWNYTNPNDGNKIQRANLDGSNVEDLVTLPFAGHPDHENPGPRDVALELSQGKMYWTNCGTGKIQRSNLDGTNIEDLVTGLGCPHHIDFDLMNSKMYWTDWFTGKIQRADFNGSNLEDIVVGLDTPTGIALDLLNSKIYWAESGSGTIHRANFDGTNIEDLVTGLEAPFGIALSIPNETTVPIKEDIPYVDATVSFSPAPSESQRVGEQLMLNLNVVGGENIAGYQATIQFDETVLRFVSSANTDFLQPDIYIATPIVNGNTVTIAATSLVSESNGDGTLATLTFEITGQKASTLTLTEVLFSDGQGTLTRPRLESTELIITGYLKEDVNRDGVVDIQDMMLVDADLTKIGEYATDVNADGVVNIADLVLVAGAQSSNSTAAASALSHTKTFTLSKVDVEMWLVQAKQFNLTDPKSLRGIYFLQQLLLAIAPEETTLLANYPNPFNPETWIPYQLAKPAKVKLSIYAADGKLIRTLKLGHQAAGVYHNRTRAAYWNGKNEAGESVASGVYLYTLTAGDFTATRKMLILK